VMNTKTMKNPAVSTQPMDKKILTPAEIEKIIISSRKNNNHFKIIEMITLAKQHNIELDKKECFAGIQACVERNRLDLAYWLFDQAQNRHPIPVEIYSTLIAKSTDNYRVESILENFRASGQIFTEDLMSNALNFFAHWKGEGGLKRLKTYYQLYKTTRETTSPNLRMHAQTYIEVAKGFCSMFASNDCLQVLQDMQQVHYQPSSSLYAPLLMTALMKQDVIVLRTIVK
jgi:hypothetical protein